MWTKQWAVRHTNIGTYTIKLESLPDLSSDECRAVARDATIGTNNVNRVALPGPPGQQSRRRRNTRLLRLAFAGTPSGVNGGDLVAGESAVINAQFVNRSLKR